MAKKKGRFTALFYWINRKLAVPTVCCWVKRCFQANKAGHTGALDPLAAGMLPICFW